MGKTSKGINYDIIRPDKQSGGKYTPGYKPHLSTHNIGGRVGKQLGGAEGNTRPITGTQRFDQSRGYYQPDMGMRGGAMYNKGGRVGLKRGGEKSETVKKQVKEAAVKTKKGFKKGLKLAKYTPFGPAIEGAKILSKPLGYKKNKGGRVGKFGGGRTNLLEELGRVEAEKSNRNRRAEISRVHSELNKGYKDGGRIGFKKGTDKKWMQKVSASIKKRGTKGKCTPITKPGCTGRAKALAKTFKKMARERKSA